MSDYHAYGPLIVATPILVVIADIDRRTKRIPDRLSLLVLALTATTVVVLTLGGGVSVDASHAALGSALLTTILGALHVLRPDGLGMGDVKLALTLGLLLGWARATALDVALMVAWCLMLASGIGLVGVAISTRRRKVPARGMTVPFGPSLCAGATLVALAGPTLILP